MYSFGILLYELVCEGHNPFQEMEFRTEIDEAVIRVLKTINDIPIIHVLVSRHSISHIWQIIYFNREM